MYSYARCYMTGVVAKTLAASTTHAIKMSTGTTNHICVDTMLKSVIGFSPPSLAMIFTHWNENS